MPREQEWECTVKKPDGSFDIRVMRSTPPLAQASAEVRAIREVAGVGPKDQVPDGYRCTFSRFLREVW
jgi:hypothetical protein